MPFGGLSVIRRKKRLIVDRDTLASRYFAVADFAAFVIHQSSKIPKWTALGISQAPCAFTRERNALLWTSEDTERPASKDRRFPFLNNARNRIKLPARNKSSVQILFVSKNRVSRSRKLRQSFETENRREQRKTIPCRFYSILRAYLTFIAILSFSFRIAYSSPNPGQIFQSAFPYVPGDFRQIYQDKCCSELSDAPFLPLCLL